MTDSTLATSIGFVYFDLKHECQTQATRVQHERHKCDTSDRDVTQVTQVRHEAKSLILVTIREKICFQTPTLALCQMKNYMERNIFLLRTTFWKCLVLMLKCV